MHSSIHRLALAFAITFMLLAAALGYWQVVRAPALLVREDNPRLVLAERATWRGTILDRNGIPLAFTRRGQDGLERYYPEPLAAPAVGYYSLQYGVAWAEAAFDARLRGREGRDATQLWWDDVLHKPRVGQNITLTLDITWQRAAYAALDSYDYGGAVLVADVRSGQILAMASRPIFDPNSLEADWEHLKAAPSAPLLNRAVQGKYQPGSLLQTVVLEQALRTGFVALTGTVTAPETPVVISNTVLGCASLPRGITWADMYAAGCPGPFAQLAQSMSLPAFTSGLQRWQLDRPVEFGLPGITASASPLPAAGSSLQDAVLGQSQFTLTPLHALRMALILANDGRVTPLTGVMPGFSPSAVQHDPAYAAQPQDANALWNTWHHECGLRGLASLALSGSQYAAWYMALAPADSPRYALVVLVEHAADASPARDVACRLSGALQH